MTRQVRGAVRRNRARRRLREAFRAARDAAPVGVALMLIAKRGALERPFAPLVVEVKDALAAVSRTRA